MIDRTHRLSVVKQCQILRLARSTAYYTPQPTSDSDLQVMRRIDELHLEYPFAGSRMLPTCCEAKANWSAASGSGR